MDSPRSSPEKPSYAIAEKALQRWVKERLRREPRAEGGSVFSFTFSGTTCSNTGLPLEVMMTIATDPEGKIVAASSHPGQTDTGCNSMCACAIDKNGSRFLAEMGGGDEAIGLTLSEAAFRNWEAEPSGCFCTAGNRRHKWRNAFQTLHYAAANPNLMKPPANNEPPL
jgi:hypothetical protein